MSVYALEDPRSGAPRYVGASSRSVDDRLREHIDRPHSVAIAAWIAELAALGLKPAIRSLEGGTEREWIARLSPDLNVLAGRDDDGGEAAPTLIRSITMPGDLYARARAAADADDRSLNSYVVRAVKAQLERDEEGRKKRG